MIKQAIEEAIHNFAWESVGEEAAFEPMLADDITKAIAPVLEDILREAMWAGIHLARKIADEYPDEQEQA